tara:strand:- start:3153 stop:3620 length:468 start_codon:yes stop_codon:yes gene_type:complete
MSENIDYLYAREITEDYRAELLAEKEAEWFAVFEKRMKELGINKPTMLVIWNQLNNVKHFDRLIKTLETLSTGTTEEIANELSIYLAMHYAPSGISSSTLSEVCHASIEIQLNKPVIGALKHNYGVAIRRSIESHVRKRYKNINKKLAKEATNNG